MLKLIRLTRSFSSAKQYSSRNVSRVLKGQFSVGALISIFLYRSVSQDYVLWQVFLTAVCQIIWHIWYNVKNRNTFKCVHTLFFWIKWKITDKCKLPKHTHTIQTVFGEGKNSQTRLTIQERHLVPFCFNNMNNVKVKMFGLTSLLVTNIKK